MLAVILALLGVPLLTLTPMTFPAWIAYVLEATAAAITELALVQTAYDRAMAFGRHLLGTALVGLAFGLRVAQAQY